MGTQYRCDYCGQELSPGAGYCPHCGRQVAGAPSPEYFHATAPPPGYAQPVYQAKKSGINCWWIACGACGSIVLFLVLLIPFTLQDFTKIKQKSKEAEVKQNLHAIQLALERYAVDHQGSYPAFVYGGDQQINIGSVNCFNPSGRTAAAYWDRAIHLPHDTLWLAEHGGYGSTDWRQLTQGAGASQATLGDPIQLEGYLADYPRNPFVRAGQNKFSLRALDTGEPFYAGYGGKDGACMWNLGYFGELPQLKFGADGSQEPRLDFPGGFYYHPRWDDRATNTGHIEAKCKVNPGSWTPRDADPAVAPPLSDRKDVRRARVAGYDLVAFGAPVTKGQDLDAAVTGKGTVEVFITGYLTQGQERNPWITQGQYVGRGGQTADVKDYDERPFSDGLPDFLIIHLGSGSP